MSYTPPGSLVPLFGRRAAAGSIQQGRMTAWNATTLASTVLLNEQPLENLAVLGPAVSDLAANVTVLLVPMGSSYVIAGRIRVPA